MSAQDDLSRRTVIAVSYECFMGFGFAFECSLQHPQTLSCREVSREQRKCTISQPPYHEKGNGDEPEAELKTVEEVELKMRPRLRRLTVKFQAEWWTFLGAETEGVKESQELMRVVHPNAIIP
jgi:hypothetical protein